MILFTILMIALVVFAAVCAFVLIADGAWLAAVLIEPIMCVALIVLIIKILKKR